MEYFANNYRATVAVDQTAGALTLTPSTLVGAPTSYPFTLLVGAELELVTGPAAAGQWAVERGQEDSAAAAHVTGTPIDHVITAGMFERLYAAIAAGGGGGGGGAAPPTALLADYTWNNQGAATAVDTAAGIFMQLAGPSSINLRSLLKPLPAAPWTATAEIFPNHWNVSWQGAGLVLRDSATGAMISVLSVGAGAAASLQGSTWPDDNGPSVNRVSPGILQPEHLWIRIVNDGTNLTYSYSTDGVNYRTPFWSHAVALYGAMNRIGFGIDNESAQPVAITLRDLVIT